MQPFQLNFLDHVAIKVTNIDVSIAWYEKVLGLKRCILPEWGNHPVLMLAGRSGVAIFQAKETDAEISGTKKIRIDHFAFNVSRDDLEAAKKHYEEIGLAYEFQYHFYFHSIYTKDPDGHTVELTAIVVDENNVYK